MTHMLHAAVASLLTAFVRLTVSRPCPVPVKGSQS